jgi:hypothetical protein
MNYELSGPHPAYLKNSDDKRLETNNELKIRKPPNH